MDQTWSGSVPGGGVFYGDLHNWGSSNNQFLGNSNEHGVQYPHPSNHDEPWIQNPYQQAQALSGPHGFEGSLQYDGNGGEYEYARENREVIDEDQDGLTRVEKFQLQETNRLIDEGIYRGLIASERDFNTQSRLNHDITQAMRAGALENEVSNVTLQYWVAKLFVAFKNTQGVTDKKNKNGNPAQAVTRIIENYYPDKTIELACWRIVLDCLKVQQYGIQLVDLHHNTKPEEYETFEDRIWAVIKVCRESKAACKQVLDPPFYHRLIDAPHRESFVKANNRKVNEKRDVQNRVGRRTIKEKGLDVDALDDVMKIDSLLNPEDYNNYDSNSNSNSYSDSEDEEAADTPTQTTTKKRASVAKPSSTSKRPSGPARTPSKAVSTPQKSPPLSVKRKRRSGPAKNYTEGDENSSEDSDVSEYGEDEDIPRRKRSTGKRSAAEHARPEPTTPSRVNRRNATPRRPSSQRPRASVTAQLAGASAFDSNPKDQQQVSFGLSSDYQPRNVLDDGNSNEVALPSSFKTEFPTAPSFGSPQQLASSSNIDHHPQFGLGPDPGSFNQSQVVYNSGSDDPSQNSTSPGYSGHTQSPSTPYTNSQFRGSPKIACTTRPTLASDNENAGKMKYKALICEMLQVDRQLAKVYTLEQLRTYARAYNRQFAADFWELHGDNGGRFLCQRFQAYTIQQGDVPLTIPHFTILKNSLAYLAVCRGDVNKDMSINPDSSHVGGFSTNGNALQNMALGVIDNPFGLHLQLHPDPQYHGDHSQDSEDYGSNSHE